jgi:hypothetical protein
VNKRSTRERIVGRGLAASVLLTPQIASELFISECTGATHMGRTWLSKKGPARAGRGKERVSV